MLKRIVGLVFAGVLLWVMRGANQSQAAQATAPATRAADTMPAPHASAPKATGPMERFFPQGIFPETVGPDKRLWCSDTSKYKRGQNSQLSIGQLHAILAREFNKPEPHLEEMKPVLFEPSGRVWVCGGGANFYGLIGYDGKKFVDHPVPTSVTSSVFVNNVAFFASNNLIETFDGKVWTSTPCDNNNENEKLVPQADGKGIVAFNGDATQIMHWRAGKWTTRAKGSINELNARGWNVDQFAATNTGVWFGAGYSLCFVPFDPDAPVEISSRDQVQAGDKYVVEQVNFVVQLPGHKVLVAAAMCVNSTQWKAMAKNRKLRPAGINGAFLLIDEDNNQKCVGDDALFGKALPPADQDRELLGYPMPDGSGVWLLSRANLVPQLLDTTTFTLTKTLLGSLPQPPKGMLADGSFLVQSAVRGDNYIFNPNVADVRTPLRPTMTLDASSVEDPVLTGDGGLWVAERVTGKDRNEKLVFTRCDGSSKSAKTEPFPGKDSYGTWSGEHGFVLNATSADDFYLVTPEKVVSAKTAESLIADNVELFQKQFNVGFYVHPRRMAIQVDSKGQIWLAQQLVHEVSRNGDNVQYASECHLKVFSNGVWTECGQPLIVPGAPRAYYDLCAFGDHSRMIIDTHFGVAPNSEGTKDQIVYFGAFDNGKLTTTKVPQMANFENCIKGSDGSTWFNTYKWTFEKSIFGVRSFGKINNDGRITDVTNEAQLGMVDAGGNQWFAHEPTAGGVLGTISAHHTLMPSLKVPEHSYFGCTPDGRSYAMLDGGLQEYVLQPDGKSFVPGRVFALDNPSQHAFFCRPLNTVCVKKGAHCYFYTIPK